MKRVYTFKINAIKDSEAIEEEVTIQAFDELSILTNLQCRFPKEIYTEVKATLIKQVYRFNQLEAPHTTEV